MILGKFSFDHFRFQSFLVSVVSVSVLYRDPAYLMVPTIQQEIDKFVDVVWNTHRIREQRNTLLPDGIPNHIYDFPEEYGLQDCGKGLL